MRVVPLILCSILFAACVASSLDNQAVENRGAGKDSWWEKLPRTEWQRFEPVAQPQDWFEVYRVHDGVFAIYEPGQFEEVISYLIVGDERALLFDTGLGIGDIGRLVRDLTTRPVSVLNSHGHYDHIGGNHQFDHIYGRDNEYARRRSGGLAHAEVAEFVGPGWIWKETPPGFDRARYAIAPYVVDEVVSDGQSIELGGRVLEVLFTPGHTPDALCLLDRERRMLFTGDTFYLAPLYTHLPGSDFETYAATAAELGGLAPAVDRLMPGHNVTAVRGEYLEKMNDAFRDIASGEARFVLTDGNREYDFGGFSVITRDPP